MWLVEPNWVPQSWDNVRTLDSVVAMHSEVVKFSSYPPERRETFGMWDMHEEVRTSNRCAHSCVGETSWFLSIHVQDL